MKKNIGGKQARENSYDTQAIPSEKELHFCRIGMTEIHFSSEINDH